MKEPLREILRHPVLFFETAARLALVELGLRLFALPRLAEWIAARPERRRLRSREGLERARRFSGIVERRLLRDPSCLRSSLAHFWLAGEGAKFVIGVRREESLAAHAWVELGPSVISGARDHDKYEILYSVEKTTGIDVASARD